MNYAPPPKSQVFDELVGVAGIAAAWALVQERGGQEIYLPTRAGKSHWLTKVVGQDAATKICNYYRANHTTRLLIPSMRYNRQGEAIVRALERGATRAEAAALSGAHVRTISRYRRRMGIADEDDDGSQGDLF